MPPDSPAATKLPRRGFLTFVADILLAIPVLGPLAYSAWVVVRPQSARKATQRPAVPLRDIPEDAVRRFDLSFQRRHGAFLEDVSRVVYLRRRGNEVIALSAECTHLGCNVHYQDKQKRFACPCHKGTYDLDGNVLGGPPPQPLRRFAVKVPADPSQPVQVEV